MGYDIFLGVLNNGTNTGKLTTTNLSKSPYTPLYILCLKSKLLQMQMQYKRTILIDINERKGSIDCLSESTLHISYALVHCITVCFLFLSFFPEMAGYNKGGEIPSEDKAPKQHRV